MFLPTAVAPGGAIDVDIDLAIDWQITDVRIELVAEHVCWFRDRGSAYLRLKRNRAAQWRETILTVLAKGASPAFWRIGRALRDLVASIRRRRRSDVNQPAAGPTTPPARGFSDSPLRVLVVTPFELVPADHGGAVRIEGIWSRLSKVCDVYLLQLARGTRRRQLDAGLGGNFREIHLQQLGTPASGNGESLPPSVSLLRSADVERRIEEIVRAKGIDIVQLEYTEMAQYAAAARAAGARVVLDEVDVAFAALAARERLALADRFPESRPWGASACDVAKLQRFEVRACHQADRVLVASRSDAELLRSYAHRSAASIRVVPNGTAFTRPGQAGGRAGVLFVGNFGHLPNLDAVEYLLAEIWPVVRQLCPDARLTIVGSGLPASHWSRDGVEGVRIVGRVPVTEPFYASHAIFAAPIRAGSGTRVKLYEAFASGLAVVATRVAAEGMEARPGKHYLAADEPGDFAAALVRLLRNSAERAALGEAASAWAEDCTWDAAASRNLAVLRELAPRRSRLPWRDGAIRPEGEPVISVVIPTWRNAAALDRCLEAIAAQECSRLAEVVCVETGENQATAEVVRRRGARHYRIADGDFDHGRTRDLGAAVARGQVIVFVNQDTVAASRRWLDGLTRPIFEDDSVGAVQGGIVEASPQQFFWGARGLRFHFTAESRRWIARHGLGFSTVNAAIRRDLWARVPFGDCPILEDKHWQRRVADVGMRILQRPEAVVLHSHTYDLSSLCKRCLSEGVGWRSIGERYATASLLADWLNPGTWRTLARGLWRGQVRRPAELWFPVLRPLMLWLGNRFLRAMPR